MGLFGFGSKKEKTAAAGKNDPFTLSGPANAASAKCIMTAGIRGVALEANLSGDGEVTMTHGPVTISGENAIETYLDIKGEGMPLKPKKARHLGDQNRWIEVASQLLDQGNKVDQVLNKMNDILGSQDFLVGPLTLADSVVAGSILTLKKNGNLPSGLSNVDAWLARVEDKIPESLRANVMSQVN
ncbi:MAG: hypothetical protein AAGB35_02870 [Pseudomonadota bacterium]